MYVILVFHALGIAYNVYLMFFLASFWSSNGINKLIATQIVFNVFNILSHAVVEVSGVHQATSTGFTALSIYSLTLLFLLKCSTSLSFRRKQSTTAVSVIIFALVFATPGLMALIGRRFELCDFRNCFASNLAITDSKRAVLQMLLWQFLTPTMVQLTSAVVLLVGHYRYNKNRMNVAAGKEGSHSFRFLYSSSAALLFILTWGEVVVQLFRFHGVTAMNDVEDSCKLSCLYDELNCVLSMFPVFLRCMIVEENKKREAS